MTRMLLAASVAALLGATAAARGLDPRAVPVPAPSFTHLPAGWRSFASPGVLTPSGARASAFATSWHYRFATPEGPGGSMPAGAVLVQVSLFRIRTAAGAPSLCARTPQLAGHPTLSLPLRLPQTTAATDESGAWPEYRIFGRLESAYDLEVRVDITSRHPAGRHSAQARRAVARIELPSWPDPASC